MITATGEANQIETQPWGKRDWRNLLLIGAVYAIAIWLMPIAHDFSYVDDWIYAKAVSNILNGHGFVPPDFSQVTLISHAYWGALFAALFGDSFTSLTAATMVLSLIGALTFYIILRRLGFSAALSLLGTALLAFNPEYLTLSYSYMTDITFLTTLLLSSLFYLEGLRDNDERWLWLGSIFTALAFLTRQFGLALPLAALLWLVFAKRLNLRRSLAVILIPALVGLVYLAWKSEYPPGTADSVEAETIHALISNPVAGLAAQTLHLLYWLPFLGLFLPLFLKVRHKLLPLATAALIGLMVYQWRSLYQIGDQENLPNAEPLLGQQFQLDRTAFWWLGVGLAAWLLSGIGELTWAWGRDLLHHQRKMGPRDFFYLLTAIIFVGTFLVNSFGFDSRYQLVLFPALIILLLRHLQMHPRQIAVVLVALCIIASYSIALHLDDYDFYVAQWQAGEYAIAQGASYDKLDNAFAWDGYYFYDTAIQRLDSHDYSVVTFAPWHVIDPQYLTAVRQKPGYRIIWQFPYFSRLDGFTTRYLLLQKREP